MSNNYFPSFQNINYLFFLEIATLYAYMMHDWKRKENNEELDIMIKNGRQGRKYSLICVITGHMTVFVHGLQCIIANISVWNSPEYYKNYTLYVDASFPFTWNYTPTFELLVTFQYIGASCATFAISGTDSIYCQISFHYAARYQILRLRLRRLIENFKTFKCDSEFNAEFGNIVTIHYHINRSLSFS